MANAFIYVDILAEVVAQKLGEKIKLYPLAKVEDLNGKAGENVTVPTVKYIGDAEDVAAGTAIPVGDFTQEKQTVGIKKAGKALKFNQEDINNHYLDLQGEAEKQLTKSIANKIEADLFTALKGATLTANIATLDTDGLAEAVVPFGEDIDEQMYLFVNPADLAALRKDDNFIVNANHDGKVVGNAGAIFGMQVIVTNHVAAKAPIIMKEEAVALYLRKGVEVEMDKDILTQTHVIVGTAHYAVVLHDASKAIAVTVA